jgi:hypothetical protein
MNNSMSTMSMQNNTNNYQQQQQRPAPSSLSSFALPPPPTSPNNITLRPFAPPPSQHQNLASASAFGAFAAPNAGFNQNQQQKPAAPAQKSGLDAWESLI